MEVRCSNVLGLPLAKERGNRNFVFRCKPEIPGKNIFGSKFSVMGIIALERTGKHLLTSQCLIT